MDVKVYGQLLAFYLKKKFSPSLNIPQPLSIPNTKSGINVITQGIIAA